MGRDSDMLRMRNAYIKKLWEYHQETQRQHSDMATPAAEDAAHDEWSRARAADTSVKQKEPPRLRCPACANHYS